MTDATQPGEDEPGSAGDVPADAEGAGAGTWTGTTPTGLRYTTIHPPEPAQAEPPAPTDMTDGAATAAPRAPARPSKVWAVFALATFCTALDVCSGVLVSVVRLGIFALLPVIPAWLAAIPLLAWVGRQGIRSARTAAIVVGVFLALSLPIAVATGITGSF